MSKPSLVTAAMACTVLFGTGVAVRNASNRPNPVETAAAKAASIAPLSPDTKGPCGVIQRFVRQRPDLASASRLAAAEDTGNEHAAEEQVPEIGPACGAPTADI